MELLKQGVDTFLKHGLLFPQRLVGEAMGKQLADIPVVFLV